MPKPTSSVYQNAELKQAVFEQSAAGIAVTDLDGLITLSNERFKDIVNIDSVDNLFINEALNQALSLQELTCIKECLLNQQKQFHILEIQVPFYETHLTWCIIKISLLRKDQKTSLIFVVDDITGDRKSIPRMATHLLGIIDTLPILIAHIDFNNRFIFANKTYESFFNTPLEKVIGSTVEDIIGAQAFKRSKIFMKQVREGKTVSYDNTLFYANQLTVLHITLVPGETQQGDFYIYGQDVTELRSLQRSLEFKAYHDYLTGLPNRSFFLKSLNSLLRNEQQPSALLFIDLDGLKETNDSFGHEIGDQLIQFFANTFSTIIRPQDIVSRLGGDEFTIILNKLEQPYQDTAEICEHIFNTLPDSIELNGFDIQCCCSIGAVILDFTQELDAEAWIVRADKAMYKAKKRGHGGYIIE